MLAQLKRYVKKQKALHEDKPEIIEMIDYIYKLAVQQVTTGAEDEADETALAIRDIKEIVKGGC